MQYEEHQVHLWDPRLYHVLQQYMLPGLTAAALGHLRAACGHLRSLVDTDPYSCLATAAAGQSDPLAIHCILYFLFIFLLPM